MGVQHDDTVVADCVHLAGDRVGAQELQLLFVVVRLEAAAVHAGQHDDGRVGTGDGMALASSIFSACAVAMAALSRVRRSATSALPRSGTARMSASSVMPW